MSKTNELQEIYKIEANKYEKTRDIQWKFNLSVWTFLVFATYAKATSALDMAKVGECVLWFIYGLFIIIHALFIYNIHGSTDRSLSRMRNAASVLLTNQETTWDDIDKKTVTTNVRWQILQVGITMFFILLFIAVKGK